MVGDEGVDDDAKLDTCEQKGEAKGSPSLRQHLVQEVKESGGLVCVQEATSSSNHVFSIVDSLAKSTYELEKSTCNLEKSMAVHAETTNKRLDSHDKRLDSHDKRLDSHDKKFDALASHAESTNKKFDALMTHAETADERLDSHDAKFHEQDERIATLTAAVARYENRALQNERRANIESFERTLFDEDKSKRDGGSHTKSVAGKKKKASKTSIRKKHKPFMPSGPSGHPCRKCEKDLKGRCHQHRPTPADLI